MTRSAGQEVGFDLARARAETPGVANVLHFNNAGCALPPRAVTEAMLDHIRLEAEIGGYEAHYRRRETVDPAYSALSTLLNAGRDEIAVVENATRAWDIELRGPRGTGFLYVRRALVDRLDPPLLDNHAANRIAHDRYELPADAPVRDSGVQFCRKDRARRRGGLCARLVDLRRRDEGSAACRAPARGPERALRREETRPRRGALRYRHLLAPGRPCGPRESGTRRPRDHVRASPHYYTSDEEVDTFARAVAHVAREAA